MIEPSVATSTTATYYSMMSLFAQPLIAMLAVSAVACFLLLTATVTLLACKLITMKALTTATTTHHQVHPHHDKTKIISNPFATVDAFLGMTNTSPFTESSEQHQNLAPSIINSIINESSSNNGSRVVVSTDNNKVRTSVRFELEHNQVHEIMNIHEYSQEEKQSCWYTRDEFIQMHVKALSILQKIKQIEQAKNNNKASRHVRFGLMEHNQVHEIMNIHEYSLEETTSCWYTRDEFIQMHTKALSIQQKIKQIEQEAKKARVNGGPSFEKDREPSAPPSSLSSQPEYDGEEVQKEEEEEEPIIVQFTTSACCSSNSNNTNDDDDDDLQDLWIAFSKLSLEENNITSPSR